MGNKRILFISIFGILLIILGIWLGSLLPKKYNWAENYHYKTDEPFSAEVFLKLLDAYFENQPLQVIQKDLDNKLLNPGDGHKNYVYISYEFEMNDSTLKNLNTFIEKGNTAFIAANMLGVNVQNHFFHKIQNVNEVELSTEDTLDSSDSTFSEIEPSALGFSIFSNYLSENITTSFLKKPQEISSYSKKVRDSIEENFWVSFEKKFIDSSFETITPIAQLQEGGYNLIKLKIGKGEIYFFTTPLFLTNFFLIQDKYLPYTSEILALFPEGEFLWDEYSKTMHEINNPPAQEEGPLEFILKQPALRWSWYLLLSGAFLFILFRAKRNQRIIPIAEQNVNKSLEFVQTIGRMYYLENDISQLIHQKMKLLHQTIKEKYKLSASDINQEYIHALSLKSGLQEEKIKEIYSTYKEFSTKTLQKKDLIHFHTLTEYFYNNCK